MGGGTSIDTVKKILALGRLRFLSIGFSLYLLGAMLALFSGARFDPGRFAFGYLILFFGHLSVHYSNDYFDVEADRRNRSSATSGGSGILVENPGLLGFSKWFGLALALLSILGAALFTAAYAVPPLYLALAVLGNLISWYYTAPPLRMAYRPWGVLASTFSVGFMMPAIGDFSMGGGFSRLFLAYAIPLALQALAFLISVQVPDMAGDRRAGKRTLVASYGRNAGFAAMLMLLAAATAYYAAASLVLESMIPAWAAIVSLLSLGMAAHSYRRRNAREEVVMRLVKYNVICYVLSILLLDVGYMAVLIAYIL